jgi:branched-chain amino acid transport system substrate-binding protein
MSTHQDTDLPRRHAQKLLELTQAMVFLLGLIISLDWVDITWAAETNSDLVFGMSTALTGPAVDLGNNMKTGVLVGFHRGNKDGGIRGRRLRLIALDDGYEPSRTILNIRKLIEEDHVLGIIGNVGTPTAIAALPIINEHHTLFFAPFTGAGVLRKSPPDRSVINFRASYEEETAAIIGALVRIGKIQPEEIAFFSQQDGYGDSGYNGGLIALTRHGLKPEHHVTHVRYERNTLAVEEALATIMLAEPLPRAVILIGAYAPCAKFIRMAREAGLQAIFLNVSFVGSLPLAEALGPAEFRTIITQVVPHPVESGLPLVKEFRQDLHAYDPKEVPNFGSLEGYIAARILIRALENTTDPITGDTMVPALEQLDTFELGLDHSLQLNALHHQASHQVWATQIKDGKVVPFDWKNLPHILKRP